jgi:hypothetical protein
VAEVVSLEEGSRERRLGGLVEDMVRGGGEADQMVVSEDHVVGDAVEMRSESVALLDQQLFNHIPKPYGGGMREEQGSPRPAEKIKMGISLRSNCAKGGGNK